MNYGASILCIRRCLRAGRSGAARKRLNDRLARRALL